MNYIQKQAALAKLASLRRAINYVLRSRMVKRAEPLFLSPDEGISEEIPNSPIDWEAVDRQYQPAKYMNTPNYPPIDPGVYYVDSAMKVPGVSHSFTAAVSNGRPPEGVKYVQLPNGQFVTTFSSMATSGKGRSAVATSTDAQGSALGLYPSSAAVPLSSSAAAAPGSSLAPPSLASAVVSSGVGSSSSFFPYIFPPVNRPVLNGSADSYGKLDDVKNVSGLAYPKEGVTYQQVQSGDAAAHAAGKQWTQAYDQHIQPGLGMYSAVGWNPNDCHTTTAASIANLKGKKVVPERVGYLGGVSGENIDKYKDFEPPRTQSPHAFSH